MAGPGPVRGAPTPGPGKRCPPGLLPPPGMGCSCFGEVARDPLLRPFWGCLNHSFASGFYLAFIPLQLWDEHPRGRGHSPLQPICEAV